MPKSPGRPAARLGDGVAKGIIVQGEASVLIGGAAKPVACKECKANAILLQGAPVNAGSGAKILPDETDFALPAARPLVWNRFYASDTPFIGLLGQGWRTFPEIALYADSQRTRLTDQQGRWIDYAPLAPGEAQLSPSESLWLARGAADSPTDPATVWDGPWQWLPASARHNPHTLIATPGDGDYLLFTRPDSTSGSAAGTASGTASGTATASTPASTPDPETLHGAYELTTQLDRNGYATHLHWHTLANARGQTHRLPEFIEDSAHRIYRLHYLALPDETRRLWDVKQRAKLSRFPG